MNEISGKAFGKLNLSLDVTGRRGDGYHLVRMVMQTVNLYDTVTIRRTAGPEIDVITDSGKLPAGSGNLVWQAAHVMRRRFGITDGLSVRLEKRIPIAAGMAGGSADAAAVFRLLRELYVPEVSDAELERLSLPLGADIPYCITGGTKLCEGIGEVLTPLPAAPACRLLIVRPDIDVSTGWVYRKFDDIPAEKVRHPDVDGQVNAIRRGDLGGLCNCLGNVLEQKTGEMYPVIGGLERYFLEHGAMGALMTGSGPTVFAIYGDSGKADAAYAQLQEEPAYRNFMKFRTEFVEETIST